MELGDWGSSAEEAVRGRYLDYCQRVDAQRVVYFLPDDRLGVEEVTHQFRSDGPWSDELSFTALVHCRDRGGRARGPHVPCGLSLRLCTADPGARMQYISNDRGRGR